VEGRFKLYVASMEQLLNPAQRVPKITRFDVDVPLAVGLRTVEDGKERQIVGMTIVLPAGMNSAGLGNFDHKAFVRDLVELKLRPDALTGRLTKQLGEDEAKKLVTELQAAGAELRKSPERPIETMRKHPRLVEAYTSCGADIENDGHRFGEDLPDSDKQALIAFLATL
jgi:hypothetical protein